MPKDCDLKLELEDAYLETVKVPRGEHHKTPDN